MAVVIPGQMRVLGNVRAAELYSSLSPLPGTVWCSSPDYNVPERPTGAQIPELQTRLKNRTLDGLQDPIDFQ